MRVRKAGGINREGVREEDGMRCSVLDVKTPLLDATAREAERTLFLTEAETLEERTEAASASCTAGLATCST